MSRPFPRASTHRNAVEVRGTGQAESSAPRRIFLLPAADEAQTLLHTATCLAGQGSALPGPDDGVLVREDHGLDAVTQAELRQDVRDVGFDRGRAHRKLLGDLRVGPA